jgi:hypothetical protein
LQSTVNDDSHKSASNPEATFVVEKEIKPEVKGSGSILSSLSDLPKLGGQSSLSDLPPLTANSLAPNNRVSPVKLASLKKVPSIEKPSIKPATVSDEPTSTTTAVSASAVTTTTTKAGIGYEDAKALFAPPLKSNLSLEDEEIEEEMDDFLNSSVSASEDFTKDETASEAASLKADFVENLS